MMRKFIFTLVAILSLTTLAQNAHHTIYRYRVTLTDKKGTPFSVKHPEQFLSPKAIARRAKFRLRVDHHDLPISPHYLDALRQQGVRIFNLSKWNNTVQIEVNDTTLLTGVRRLPFVKGTEMVYDSSFAPPATSPHDRKTQIKNRVFEVSDFYGAGAAQTDMLNLRPLHEAGFRGQGMTIAVIDGGFYNTDTIAAFQSTKILGTRNFARPGSSVYDDHEHGTMVLSCIATNLPHRLVGTAPEAAFYLLESEDTAIEYRGEADNWCAALEYADSLGVDIVTTSLGYHLYEAPRIELKYEWLDGQTELNSRSASLAASRGLLLLNAAGNEGEDTWKKITFPSDAHDILTVGAVDRERHNSTFSGVGYTADGRIKPDLMAMGSNSAVIDGTGSVSMANGTSFATPILAGAVACLWQAVPTLSPQEVIGLLQQSGSNYAHPNEIYGYGVPDLWKVYQNLGNKTK